MLKLKMRGGSGRKEEKVGGERRGERREEFRGLKVFAFSAYSD